MNILDNYLQSLTYIQEIGSWTKKERDEVKRVRESSRHIWLYHGTTVDQTITKKEGILPEKMTAKNPAFSNPKSEFYKIKCVFLSSCKFLSNLFTFPKKVDLNWKKEGYIVLTKVDTKYLRFFRKPRFTNADEYLYTKAILPKNIVVEKTKEFSNIEKNNRYLVDKL